MKMGLVQQLAQDTLTVAIETHSLHVRQLLIEAFPDKPEIVDIYEEKVAPAWADFVAELVGRATSQSASAVVSFQKRNDARLDRIEGHLGLPEFPFDALADGD